MPAPLVDAQRYRILRSLFEGCSFGEAATEIGCSKSTAFGIWSDFKAGQIPRLEHFEEYAEIIREAAIEMRKSGVSPEEAILGMAALRYLAELGLEPSRLEEYSQLCERLIGEEKAPEVIQAGLELQKLEVLTGMDYRALSDHTTELDKRRSGLVIEVANLEKQRDEIHTLQTKEIGLKDEVKRLSTQRDRLHSDVGQLQRREEHLAGRVEDLEARSSAADKRLAVARKATEEMATLGLDLKDLPGLAQRLGAIAGRHSWKIGELRDRLLAELEMLDLNLTVDSVKAELEVMEVDKVRVEGTISGLLRQQKHLEGLLLTLGNQAHTNLERLGQQITASTNQTAELLRNQHEGLIQKTLKLGENVGRLEAELRTHEWLEPLLALVGEKEDLHPQNVRYIGLILLKSLHNWVGNNHGANPIGMKWNIESLIRGFEGWKI